jgi:hypothetical protein
LAKKSYRLFLTLVITRGEEEVMELLLLAVAPVNLKRFVEYGVSVRVCARAWKVLSSQEQEVYSFTRARFFTLLLRDILEDIKYRLDDIKYRLTANAAVTIEKV